MNWFQGEIAQAVVTSKAKQAIFVVYVYGKDEKSSQFTNLINQEEVAKILGGESFVAIQIEAETVPYEQFSQIYKQVPVPSIYFIGKQGVPIEIVTEIQDAKNLQDKLINILQKGSMSPLSAQTQDFIQNEQVAPIPPKETSTPPKESSSSKSDTLVCDNDSCTIQKNEQPSTSQDKFEIEKNQTDNKELTVEEKVERAKQLVEKKREEKLKEEMEKERQQEIERRKMGQNIQQLKRWQDDQELKAVLEEREKEKRESQAARERVLAQIAQDKAERAAKFSPPAPSQPTPSPPPPAAAPRPPNSNSARIQFKMPDGRTATNDFSSSDSLQTVHTYIKGNLNLPFSSYTLSTTFPRKEFSDDENKQSLLELGLVPTAVILILPINRGTISTSATGGGVTGLFWTLLTPFFTILGYLKTFVFGSGPAQNSTNENQNKRSSDSNNDSKIEPKIRRAGETTVIRRQGNVHRLSNKNDSDDENNTWNGNSTQQM